MKNQTPMELNKRLAELMGWTDLFDAGGMLMGCPPGGSPSSRDQAAVPNWAGDWAAAGPLAMECGIRIEPMSSGVAVGGFFERYCEHADIHCAAWCGIVKSAICRLEAAQ